MSVPLKKVLRRMSPKRRAAVEADAARMIVEELTLSDLRKVRQLTQEKLAKQLGIKQESVSNLEKRSDMLLSTLRQYVVALGGELELQVRFPNRPSVVLNFSEATGKPARAMSPKGKHVRASKHSNRKGVRELRSWPAD